MCTVRERKKNVGFYFSQVMHLLKLYRGKGQVFDTVAGSVTSIMFTHMRPQGGILMFKIHGA